ncbi:hypothetical protein HN018_06700 [Lichenicola cladoniae]|uniref:Uncharacterized protein n=1 Tax=Lichenicola cladoniae TaxID=1484109 RepID=A0A6M8HN72_9PROT|nr:hypothetical protein [Lichenicola cladoniae]NPD67261.1 hypothetical protein [Acetobacteraceae bacterium]QKE89766.1 hypothetical protein HN018_06700 [Lichenicola cladoniae]
MKEGDARPCARDVIAGVLDKQMLGAEPAGTPIEEADRVLAALAAAGLEPNGCVINSAIVMAWSEYGAGSLLRGEAIKDEFEDWPGMDQLLTAIDLAAPGWRRRSAPPAIAPAQASLFDRQSSRSASP